MTFGCAAATLAWTVLGRISDGRSRNQALNNEPMILISKRSASSNRLISSSCIESADASLKPGTRRTSIKAFLILLDLRAAAGDPVKTFFFTAAEVEVAIKSQEVCV